MVSRQMFPDVPRCSQMFPGIPQMFPGIPQMFPGIPQMFPGIPQMFPDVPRCSQMFPDVPRNPPDVPRNPPDVPRNPPDVNHIVYNHVYLSEAIHELYNVLCETIIRYTTCNFIVAMCISEYLVRCRGPVRGRARVVKNMS